MRARREFSSIIGVLAFLAASGAAAQSYPVAGGAFDGTYGFVSGQTLTQTFTDRHGRTGYCPEQRPGPLMVSQGQAWYTTGSGRQIVGTINPQGGIAMQVSAPGQGRTLEVQVGGAVDTAGTARLHQMGNSCSYYFTWQRQ